MLAEKIMGNCKEQKFYQKEIDYVDIEWHETFKKIHKKVTGTGREIGIRLDNDILTKGLRQDDILYMDENLVVAVNIPPCEAIIVKADKDHRHMLVKAAYEIGNKHSTAFWGKDYNEIIIPYSGPIKELLEKIHGVHIEQKEVLLDFGRSISAGIHHHTHG